MHEQIILACLKVFDIIYIVHCAYFVSSFFLPVFFPSYYIHFSCSRCFVNGIFITEYYRLFFCAFLPLSIVTIIRNNRKNVQAWYIRAKKGILLHVWYRYKNYTISTLLWLFPFFVSLKQLLFLIYLCLVFFLEV